MSRYTNQCGNVVVPSSRVYYRGAIIPRPAFINNQITVTPDGKFSYSKVSCAANDRINTPTVEYETNYKSDLGSSEVVLQFTLSKAVIRRAVGLLSYHLVIDGLITPVYSPVTFSGSGTYVAITIPRSTNEFQVVFQDELGTLAETASITATAATALLRPDATVGDVLEKQNAELLNDAIMQPDIDGDDEWLSVINGGMSSIGPNFYFELSIGPVSSLKLWTLYRSSNANHAKLKLKINGSEMDYQDIILTNDLVWSWSALEWTEGWAEITEIGLMYDIQVGTPGRIDLEAMYIEVT